MSLPLRRSVIALLLLGTSCAGCLRGPLREERVVEGGSAGTGAGESAGQSTGGEVEESTGSSSSGPGPEPQPECHPSYQPCLPIVDDLNCPDVVALGAAPVTVIGPDEYGLDADNDGIGCEDS